MRRRTVRSGMRFMAAGVICVILATFFQGQLSRLLFMGMADQARLTFFGFLVGWILSGWGALVAVAGFVQSGQGKETERLAPAFLLLVSLIILFFVLAYNAMTSPPSPQLRQGETVDI